MTEPTSTQELFKGRHFDQEIIVLCVRWYLTFKLSSRDLVQMGEHKKVGASRFWTRIDPELKNPAFRGLATDFPNSPVD
jgi:hypothetical protein